MQLLGNKIRNARIKAGMTQEQLAVALDTTKAAISRYEAGKREPNLELLRKIALATKVTVADLVDDEYWAHRPEHETKAAFASDPELEILCGLFSQLNEAGRQKALEWLEDLLEVEKYRK